MKKASFDAIVQALNRAQVPFLIVDGIAVIHYGYGTFQKKEDQCP